MVNVPIENMIVLAKGYIDEYKRTIAIDRVLRDFDLYINDEGNKMIGAVEKFFNDIDPMIIDALLEFAENDSVTFYEDDVEHTVYSVEGIFKEMLYWE